MARLTANLKLQFLKIEFCWQCEDVGYGVWFLARHRSVLVSSR